MNANFVIMGLPASGKTTFLAALWHVIEADEINCRLRLDRYEGDLKYLNSIAEAWRTFQKVPRTSQVGDKDVAIYVVDSETRAKGRAFFPDLAGETFDTQIESRRCRPGFVSNMESSDGVLLFISADSKQDSISIVELNSMMPSESGAVADALRESQADAAARSPAEQTETIRKKFKEWEPEMVPAQVRIVQLLSDLLRAPFALRCRRLAVLLSAWDVVKSTQLTPQRWLALNMPLVDQFLLANQQSFEVVIYGVSAQGLSLKDTAAVNEAVKLPPSRRISIVGPSGSGHDISVPLVWLMSGS